jgi:trans-aconitate methyltransferase
MDPAAGYITDVPYVAGYYPQLAPTALRHVAALNRVVPPRVAEQFRYLELGCGLGRSLTTLAAANPQGEFVGIDINPQHTAATSQPIPLPHRGRGMVAAHPQRRHSGESRTPASPHSQ